MEYFSKGPRLKKARKGSMPKNVSTILKEDGRGKDKLSSLQIRAFSAALREKLAAGHYNSAGTASAATGAHGVKTAPGSVSDEDSVSDEEAIEAASILDKSRRRPLVGHLQYGAAGGALAPLVAAAGRGVKGFVDTPGGVRSRARGAAKGMAASSAGDIAGLATKGFLTSAALSKAREELTESAAERRVNRFLQQHRRRGS